MVRDPLTPDELARGRRLGAALREARGAISIGEVAAVAGISVETLRKIETGRIPTPAFFTVAALAAALDVSLNDLLIGSSLADGDARASQLRRRFGRFARPLGDSDRSGVRRVALRDDAELGDA
jgi:transcriptional regulator with XRE-family HTH domain